MKRDFTSVGLQWVVATDRRLISVIALLALAVCLVLALGAVGGAQPANETTEHEHPDEAEDEGDEGAVSEWLQGQLDDRLGESSVQLNEGQYDGAREAVGDEYDELLSNYAEVENASEEDDERRSAEELEEVRDNQRNLTDEVESYDQTYEEYEQAVEDGDEDRARELARELDDLAASIEERSERTDEAYERSEEETGSDRSSERESVEDVRSEIDSRHSEVREEQFLETELEVESDRTEVSFTDPVTLTGTVTTEEGDPVANEPIGLAIDEQRMTTTTDMTGSFTVDYRPTVLPLNTSTIDVEYVPERGSPYGGSNTSVPISVTQVDSTTEIDDHTETAAFGDDLVVNGTVSADGTEADAVPVLLAIDGEEYDRTETTENGTFSLNTSLPADVPAGDADVRVLTDLDERALANSEAAVPVEVTETPGVLEVRAEPTGEEGAIVAGELTTGGGEPLSEQTIEIDVDGERTTVETGEEGTFERTVTLPEDQSSVTVTVSYADSGSNIEDVEESMTLEREGVGPAGSIDGMFGAYDLPASTEVLGVGLLVTLLGLTLVVGLVRYVRLKRNVDADRDSGRIGSPVGTPTDGAAARALLSLARERLETGETDRAIELAYTAARLALGRGPSEAQTHWEFYEKCLSDGLTDDERRRLESLTENFETAAFAPWSSSETEANESIGNSDRFVE